MFNKNGYTLVELAACLAVISATLAMTLPPLSKSLENGRKVAATNQLLGALHYARGVAVNGRNVVTLCPGQINCLNANRWQSELLIFEDRNKNAQIDSNERLLKVIHVQPRYNWIWSNFRGASYLQYEPDGTTRALNGTFTLCSDNQPHREIVINLTGRVRTQPASGRTKCL